MLAGAAVGAALGYILGGYFLDIYVDVGRVDMSRSVGCLPSKHERLNQWCFNVGLTA